MASAVHAAQSSYPTPSFSRESSSKVNPFQISQSIVSTPTQTPPPSRGHQRQMSFNMGGYGPPNGMYMQQGSSGVYADVNGTLPQQQYPLGPNPQIYTAVYSGISVYEMEVNKVAVMRRRADSWLNATQILKVAGVDKGKRTKVLEKEILAGEHEKVQGGYGKYQGTWINYTRGREFCRQYGVEELLRPLLEYDMGQDGITIAGQGSIETPTKEQAMAAQRKKMMYNGGSENRPSAQSPNGTFFKNISATAANAVNAINKARFDSPVPRPGSGNKRPAATRRPSQQVSGNQESAFPGSSQQSLQSLHSEGSFGINGQLETNFGAHATPYFLGHYGHNGDSQEPPRKRARPSSSQDHFTHNTNSNCDLSMMREPTPTEPNESFAYQQHQATYLDPNMDHAITGVQPLPQPNNQALVEKQQALVSLFLDPSQTDFSNHTSLKRLSGEDLDIPIDSTAHTALHWAATLARIPLLRALIAKGASIFRVNGGGETALIRAALTTNNLDQGSFPALLELLGPTIPMRDGRGRTVLHHIAVSSAVKGRSAASRYYLESLLEFVVCQGSATNSQQTSFIGTSDHLSLPKHKSIGLARFMAEIVNATDMSGDTALNLAARIGNKGIIQQLLEVGADPTVANRGGLKPVDFGVGGDPEPTDSQHPSQQLFVSSERPVGNKVVESSRDLMSSISTLLADTENSFRSEVQAKQSLIDKTHARLREATSLLSEERRKLEELHRKAEECKELSQKVANLRRANKEQKAQLTRDPPDDVKVGDADNGLTVELNLLPSPSSSPQALVLSPEQHDYLSNKLPRIEILQARVSAYKANNHNLKEQAKQLNGRSTELEKKLRRVVALCTNTEERKVDALIDGLVVAVESEKGEDVEVGRVRDFLRKVEGVEV